MRPVARILVVDDEDVLRTSIGTILQRHGYEVALAPNVPEALAAIQAEFFDVLLSDLRMPGPGDGLTVVRAMQERHPSAVTLLMSTNVDSNASNFPLQADEILQKPFHVNDVVSLIQAKLALAG